MKIGKYYVIEYENSFDDRVEIVRTIGKKALVETYDPFFGDSTLADGYKDIILKKYVTCSEARNVYPFSESEFLTKKEKTLGKVSSLRILEIFFLLNKNYNNEKINEDKRQKRLVPKN